MSLFLRMFLLAVVMVAGFSLALSGVLMGFFARERMPVPAVSLFIGGLAVGVVSLVRLVILNRRHLVAKREAIRADTDAILDRWLGPGGEDVLLARSGLLVGEKLYVFDEFYSSLSGVRLEPEGVLVATIQVSGGRRSYGRDARVPVPPEHRPSVGEAVIALRGLYHLESASSRPS